MKVVPQEVLAPFLSFIFSCHNLFFFLSSSISLKRRRGTTLVFKKYIK